MSTQGHGQEQFEIIIGPVAATVPAGADCAGCASSCQSACKTSCTVGNQPCTAVNPVEPA